MEERFIIRNALLFGRGFSIQKPKLCEEVEEEEIKRDPTCQEKWRQTNTAMGPVKDEAPTGKETPQ